MVSGVLFLGIALSLGWLPQGAAQESGSIRGVVYDADFDTPLSGVKVKIVKTGQEATSTEQGTYVIRNVAPGEHTLVFTKEGYKRQLKSQVVVGAGQLKDVNAALPGDYTIMDDFVVQSVLQVDAGSETALLELRFESAALMDSIGSDLMSKAGASDASDALRLVSGASVADGKSAVIRGLPDRYVSSQMNGVRLPTADEDKRAVELDQFPSPVLESIQVSKTFTPDQQGDASGGAVDVRLKGIPQEGIVQFKSQFGYGSQTTGRSDFLTYDGGGVSTWGRDDGGRDIQDNFAPSLGAGSPPVGEFIENWNGAVGVSEDDAPIDHKWSAALGGSLDFDSFRIGAFVNFFYERDSLYYDDGQEDSWWVDQVGGELVPEYNQGSPFEGEFRTSLFDITKGEESVQWGSLGTAGIEFEDHFLGLTYLYTRHAEDEATLAEDTRGKEYYFPGYNPDNPLAEGNDPDNRAAAPYLRLETLQYTERTSETLQFNGRHTLPVDEFDVLDTVQFRAPEFDWVYAFSSADMDQPDKRQFGAEWWGPSVDPGAPPFIDPFDVPAEWFPYKPDANFSLGNLQRIWKKIEEDSDQYAANFRLPFQHSLSPSEGYVKVGVFEDKVDRKFDQDSFSNFGDSGSSFVGDYDDSWSEVFPDEDHPIEESLFDVDYRGDLEVSAWYYMVDLPLVPTLNFVGGARYETTKIGIVNIPEENATWFPPGDAVGIVELNPGDADVEIDQDDVLPSLGLVYEPSETFTIRASYSETIARQTFKELTPILQQEFAGGPIFVGNPELALSDLKNYDIRVDHRPFAGSLFSVSFFHKDIDDPIEYIQRVVPFKHTFPVNYPDGWLTGWELEARQELGEVWEPLSGVSVGANATFINSKVSLTEEEILGFAGPATDAPITSRDMANAPEHLYNLYFTYDIEQTGTQVGLFYTVQGDTLLVGAGLADEGWVPSIYAKEYDTLNLSIAQELGKYFTLQFRAKNLTNPTIEEVYRSDYIAEDVRRSSFTKGIDYSISLNFNLAF